MNIHFLGLVPAQADGNYRAALGFVRKLEEDGPGV